MDRPTRNAIEKATQRARRLLEDDFTSQLEGTYDVLRSGTVAAAGGPHLSAREKLLREKIVASIEHKHAAGMKPAEAVADAIRDAAFTTLNRFVALKMLEARGLLQECITQGEQSAGYREFCGLAPGVALLPDGAGFRLYLESLFDELSTEVKVLFDRRDPAAVLWPKRATFEALLEILNGAELREVWGEDETIGWVYQYFNSEDERRGMRESQEPQNSREMAVRNQFFTPRYVVDFLVQNTLGALWLDMTDGFTSFNEELTLLLPSYGKRRQRKDPRDIRVLDPACGSGHFLLRAYDLFATIYREAWEQADPTPCRSTSRSLREDFPDINQLLQELPRLILENNLYGIDIDARCAQIAALALWMRAQRAWKGLILSRDNRLSIRRTHIVIAEPIPAGADTREVFLGQLDARLARIAQALFHRLDLAGEAGSLLDIHDWFRSEIQEAIGNFGALFVESDEERWHTTETQLMASLKSFAEDALARRQWLRNLFAADAMRGISFIDVTRETYDVVLMNPPFGDPTTRARAACGNELRDASSDVAGAFVLAAKRRWAPEGFVGVLASTTLWFKPTVAKWRSEALFSESFSLHSALHLGGQVLDGAKVSASCLIIKNSRVDDVLFVRAVSPSGREERVGELIALLRHGKEAEEIFRVSSLAMSAYRGCPLVYWISPRLRKNLVAFRRLEGLGADVRQGVACADDPRFVRAWWEVPIHSIGIDSPWLPFGKSSEFSPYWDDIAWVIRWLDDGREVRAFERSYPRSTSYFGRPGVTYPARSYLGFNPRAFPSSCGFGHMGSVAFPRSVSAEALLAYLASRPLEYILSFSTGSLQGDLRAFPNHYEVGQIKDLPWPDWNRETLNLLARYGEALATFAMHLQDDDETTHQYAARVGLGTARSLRRVIEDSVQRCSDLVERVRSVRSEVDQIVAAKLGFDENDILEMEREFARCGSPSSGPWSTGYGAVTEDVLFAEAERLASEIFGFAIGRFDIRPAITGVPCARRDSAFAPLVAGSPALLVDIPDKYPVSVSPDGILVTDRGSRSDVGRALSLVMRAIWGELATQMEQELAELLGVKEVRDYFVETGSRGFFVKHLGRYSKSRRTAPVYWSLGTSSGGYLVYIHYPTMKPDTLFLLQQDHVSPKFAHEESRLESVRADFGPNPKAAERNALAAQEAFVEELRTFLDEVKRVAPLWNPDLDDGVIINFAPLWRLVPHHKPWQKELKATWDALCAGEYDWAHLAMHLWPERVVPKCATDRSLAIAHGLEDVFWIEGEDGKWKPRAIPARPVEELVRERTSQAVKAALKSLLEAPVLAGGRARGRRAGGSS